MKLLTKTLCFKGLHPYVGPCCKECKKTYGHHYYLNNIEKMKARTSKKRTTSPEVNRNNQLKIKFGITLIEYNNMLSKQKNVCAICLKEEIAMDPRTKKIKNLAVDHCHRTSKIRGLLCQSCNHLLGRAKDEIRILNAAIEYLETNNEKNC